MAHRPRLAIAGANASTDATCDLLHGGTLNIYAGAQPATADTPTAHEPLAVLMFSIPAFSEAGGGIALANLIGANATLSGTAGWCRAVTAGGVPVFDGSVGTDDADLILTTLAIQAGAAVSVAGFTYTQSRT